MTDTCQPVLVIGATGRFAGLVVPELQRRGATVRAMIRDPKKAEGVRARGASEIVVGDLRDRTSVEAAVNGAGGVFYLGPAFAPDEAAMGVSVVEASVRAGVQRFAFSSVIQPTNVGLKNHASKVPVEESLYSSSLQYTILHPANFMQNIAGAWPAIVASGHYKEPFPTTARIARVDYRDVAELAAIALTTSRLAYATLDLCSGMFNRDEIAAMMSEALGKRIEAGEIGFDEWTRRAQLPYSDDQLRLLRHVHAHYAKYGLGGNDMTLRAALGREPRSLQDYIGELVRQTVNNADAAAGPV